MKKLSEWKEDEGDGRKEKRGRKKGKREIKRRDEKLRLMMMLRRMKMVWLDPRGKFNLFCF